MADCESSLIDLDAEIANKGQAFGQPERLNEKTSKMDDAIVRSASNRKMQRLAEMTSPASAVTIGKYFVVPMFEDHCSRVAA